METQRSVRTENGTDAPSSVVHLHGVPVPSRVLGFSAGWYRSEQVPTEASKAKRLTVLRSDAEDCAIAMRGAREIQEVAAA